LCFVTNSKQRLFWQTSTGDDEVAKKKVLERMRWQKKKFWSDEVKLRVDARTELTLERAGPCGSTSARAGGLPHVRVHGFVFGDGASPQGRIHLHFVSVGFIRRLRS
jgi:hypothetical protein